MYGKLANEDRHISGLSHETPLNFQREQSYHSRTHLEWEGKLEPLVSYWTLIKRFLIWGLGPALLLYIIYQVGSNV